MIEKLNIYRSSRDGYNWEWRPNKEDIVEKINEIIDHLNIIEKLGDKETPALVIGKSYEYQYCPRCKQEWKGWDFYGDDDRPKYCDQCGQCLNWDNYREDDDE